MTKVTPLTRGFDSLSTTKGSNWLKTKNAFKSFLKLWCFYSRLFKYNQQNGREATTYVRHFVSVSLSTVSELNIVSHLLFLHTTQIAKLVYTKIAQPRFIAHQGYSWGLTTIETANQGWVVQRWDKFNSGLSKNYCSYCFSKKKISISYKIRPGFSNEKLVNPKFTDQIRPCKVGNNTMGSIFNSGLALIDF